MIKSCKKPPIDFYIDTSVGDNKVEFYSQYAGLPLKELTIEFDLQSAVSSFDITINGTTYTISFGESLAQGTLDVLTGILTKSDSSKIYLEGLDISTILGLNTIALSIYPEYIDVSYLHAGR